MIYFDEEEEVFDFDPQDQPIKCALGTACEKHFNSRAAMFDHFRSGHAIHYAAASTPVLHGIEVDEDGGRWDSEDVWQDLDFYFKGYDSKWWDHCGEISGQSVSMLGFEPAWCALRNNLLIKEGRPPVQSYFSQIYDVC